MKRDNATINQAIEEVREGFPFPEILEQTIDTIKPIASLLREQMPAGGRLLDLGCGALDKAMVYQKMGYQCFCADDFQDSWHKDPKNLDPVIGYAQSLGIEVYTQGESFEVPWEKESFDIVTIINVIEHLHGSPRGLLNFAGTLLKPGGLLVVGMPNSVNLRKRLSVLTGGTNYTPIRGMYEFEGVWRGHIREYTLEETCQIVEWTGFDVVARSTFHGILKDRLRNRLFRSIFRGLYAVSPRLKDSLLVASRKPVDWKPREPDPEALLGVDGHQSFA